MILTAAPIVRQSMADIGAPGKTDFVRIYIASELNNPEYRTMLRHEQAHVWARHNSRRPKDVRIDLWRIACEMEIARTIYDDRDLENIKAPRSRLAGGYLPDSLKELPDDIFLAEDIYDWLLEQPEHQITIRQQCCACSCDGGNKGDVSDAIDATTIVHAAREQLDADESARISQAAAASAYASLRNRPPSLTEAVDAALRVRVEREHSHRHPSRRHAESNVILPGALSIPRPPLVEVFVDRSGSFSPAKTATAEKQLHALLSRYGATIRADVWYFGNGKLSASNPVSGGDTPYHLITQHLVQSTPKLAIVITDDDPVGAEVSRVDRRTAVVCVPIACGRTVFAAAVGGIDVQEI